mmetsp:Transcript_30613/g.71536  ORF Transcript_30613/g.71536 Transcript_30613/m.71536 type:complete len:813 (-) Transcript_30613:23-2461(-)
MLGSCRSRVIMRPRRCLLRQLHGLPAREAGLPNTVAREAGSVGRSGAAAPLLGLSAAGLSFGLVFSLNLSKPTLAETSASVVQSPAASASSQQGTVHKEVPAEEAGPKSLWPEGSAPARVVVPIEEEILQSLPVMSLAHVQAHDAYSKDGTMLVSYDGIVYDVTQFAKDHPGGCDLLKTAAGLDLEHFFANYTVHGKTDKAANWLAPLAVGKLTKEDAVRARAMSNAHSHIARRGRLLRDARLRLLRIAVGLPLWMSVRSIVRLVAWLWRPAGVWMAKRLPVTVPGVSPGCEPLPLQVHDKESGATRKGRIAVVGGGIAGCSTAWALAEGGYDVILYESREHTSGNAKTFHWDGFADGNQVHSCVSVTAWPPVLYKNYTCLLERFNIETVPMPLSWFLNSKVPGCEGSLWAADAGAPIGSLRQVFEQDFVRYGRVEKFVRWFTSAVTLQWTPWRCNDSPSMYSNLEGFGMFNPFNVVPLYALCRLAGVSRSWWDVVFTPYYTASFLVDELKPFPAVFGPKIEDQIPLLPTEAHCWKGPSKRGEDDVKLTTCVTWKDAGDGIREVFTRLTENVDVRLQTRVLEVSVLPSGLKRVRDEFDKHIDVDRVVFACPANAVQNILKRHGPYEEAILTSPIYADDLYPTSGHMHAVMHSDPTVIDPAFREDCLKRASNYVEITQQSDGSLNIENQYNFGVQTPGPGVYDMDLKDKPVMLISHALGEGKSIDPRLVRGTGNHARAHPLYSGWNIAAQLSLRLVQGRDGVYYCSNWTTPVNCHDMSLLSGFICAHAIGAPYPFQSTEAKKDFHRMRDLMGT